MRRRLGVGDDVRFLGWVSAAELEGLYAAAAAFVFPDARRGVRPAGARGDGARGAGRLLGHRGAPGGRRRRRAVLRSSRRSRRSPAPIRRLLDDRALADRLARRRAAACGAVQLAADRRGDARELPARARPRRARPRSAANGRATPARRSRQTSAASRRAAPRPPAATASIAEARSAGLLESATTPLTPSWMSSTAALSGSGDDDARRAVRSRLDDHEPVSLPPRGQQHAQRARHRLVDRLGGDETRHTRRVLEPALEHSALHLGAIGAVAEDRRSEHRAAARAARAIAGDDRGHPLLWDVTARRTAPAARPPARVEPSSGPVVGAGEHRDLPPGALVPQSSGVEPGEAEGALRHSGA